MTQNGSCQCGAVTYRIAQEDLPQTYACHCLDCQSWSGGAFSLNALLPADSLTVEGPLARYAHETPSGSHSVQQVCATCHTRIFNTNEAVPGMVILRAGTLANSQSLEPAAHIWTRRKQSWVNLPSDVPAFEETPTPTAFASALALRSKRAVEQ